ncbi:MAG TPA: hypothetical protein VHN99_02095 [Deinococcales bacterium]|nr:hypothetical protein [Deinococcales bacterium]
MVWRFSECVGRDPAEVGAEAQWLGRAAVAGVEVAPGLVLGRAAEETFYLSNNLPEQVRKLFAPLNLRRLDEQAFEAACEGAARLVLESVLLDDLTAMLQLASRNAGVNGAGHWRRPGERGAAELDGRPGSVLVALKRLWARDWDADAALARLDATGGIGLDPRPALLFAGPEGRPDERLGSAVAAALGQPGRAFAADGRLNGFEPQV